MGSGRRKRMADDNKRGPYRRDSQTPGNYSFGTREPLLPDHYRIHITGRILPPLGDSHLVSQNPNIQPKDWIEHESRREWKAHLPTEREFWAWRPYRPEDVATAIKRVALIDYDFMARSAQRSAWLPANQDEAYDFACDHQTANIQRRAPVVVPGATMLIGQSLQVLVLSQALSLRIFELRPITTVWTDSAFFLFVRAVRK